MINKINFRKLNSGDNITVYYSIIEGEKKRIQSFKGVIIKIKLQTFTVRKGEIGVERIFNINQTSITKVILNKKGKVRQSKIYYFIKLKGKKAKIKENNICH
ncbi:50S ribosomal protein L19 [Candidatus Karelsulcia muelleri]|uniref:50S ribosomal protein L19 n=1 Tax=Candidatus Karelsulcia muelleri TaxID=336810 RepID=UPI0009BDA6C0|nr:50S ribosomal protein L19 [Candidatus Karelsulcia muelleri]MBU6942185.1 50S ribosomal protein L19 [Candidatus Karelsulcia muelleri]